MLFKIFFCSFLTLSVLNQNTYFEIAKEKLNIDPTYYCIRELVQNFGLKGNIFAKKVRKVMEMCPRIQYSCCTYEDQLKIYENWVVQREEENVLGRMDFYVQLYREVLKVASEVNDQAMRIKQILQYKRQANCKVLANKVINFQIREVIQKLLLELKQYRKFFINSYKGMYCMMCDAKSHRFIDLMQQKLVYTKRFCRDMLKSNFFVQDYFSVHLVKYLNISMNFLNQCNYKGKYTEKVLDDSIILEVDEENQRMLDTCQANRNIASSWFDACKPICENFNLFSFNQFYAPGVSELAKVIEWSRLKLITINKETNLHLSVVPEIKHPFKLFRILEEKETKKTQYSRPAILKSNLPFWKRLSILIHVYKNDRIFKSGINPITDTSKFGSSFRTPIVDNIKVRKPFGLNPYKHGLTTNINETVYKQIKESIKETQAKKLEKNALFSCITKTSVFWFIFLTAFNQLLIMNKYLKSTREKKFFQVENLKIFECLSSQEKLDMVEIYLELGEQRKILEKFLQILKKDNKKPEQLVAYKDWFWKGNQLCLIRKEQIYQDKFYILQVDTDRLIENILDCIVFLHGKQIWGLRFDITSIILIENQIYIFDIVELKTSSERSEQNDFVKFQLFLMILEKQYEGNQEFILRVQFFLNKMEQMKRIENYSFVKMKKEFDLLPNNQECQF